jgi:hypothetical protein
MICLEFLFVILGIRVLWRNSLAFFGKREIRGGAAVAVGILFLAPFCISFAVGFYHGYQHGLSTGKISDPQFLMRLSQEIAGLELGLMGFATFMILVIGFCCGRNKFADGGWVHDGQGTSWQVERPEQHAASQRLRSDDFF